VALLDGGYLAELAEWVSLAWTVGIRASLDAQDTLSFESATWQDNDCLLLGRMLASMEC